MDVVSELEEFVMFPAILPEEYGKPQKKKRGRPFGARSDQAAGMMGPNYSIRGAARFLGVSAPTLRRLARLGTGPDRVKVSPNRYVYPADGLEAFMAKRKERK